VITIKVTTLTGRPLVPPQEATFPDTGGTIGRADGNTLILADSQKLISRVHASVFRADGRWMIEDRGSATPVLVNNQALGAGVRAPIGPGDVIVIGGYALQVSMPNNVPAAAEAPAQRPKDDPLALFGGGGGNDPFADLIPRPSAPPPLAPSPGRPAQQAGGGGALPADFDPFAVPANRQPDPLQSGGGGGLPDDFSLGLGPSSKTPSVDDLFELKKGASVDPFGPGHPLGEPDGKSSQSPSNDPLVAIGAGRPPDPNRRPPQRDDVPEIHGSFRPPEARPDPNVDINLFVSWDVPPGAEIKTVIIPSPGDQAPKAAPPQTPPVQPAPARQAPSPQQAPPSRDTAPASQDELLRAFLAGAGVPDLQMSGPLTPQLMQVFGTLLRTATEGTLELLLARALTKREVHAQQTIIMERDNNPLKFSPTVDAAMRHLLAPQGRGFMSPLRAMKETYDDLRAHQFGVVAGTRAALEGVLARFDPAMLEKRLAQKGVLDALLPINRKAGLWNLFVTLYGDIAKEAEEDFHTLFGREFLKAYEAQIAKLEARGKAGDKG
jgi:type VI secretion system FHA domain protein